MSSLDTLISGDLAALGEDSRRSPLAIDDALRTTNMYRDDLPGAQARRDALADERRRELFMMPLALSHVFAHRVARAAAGAVGIVSALMLVAMMGDTAVMEAAMWLVPDLGASLLCALAAIAILSSYVIATWIAEGWFARRMRQAIQTGDDPYRDLDALARGPVEIARDAVRRVDGISLGLCFAGITAVTFAFGYLVAIVGTVMEIRMASASAFARVVAFGLLAENLELVAVMLVATAAVAIALGRACRRGKASLIVRVLGHWATLGVAVFVGLGTAFAMLSALVTFAWTRQLPPMEVRYLFALGATFSITGVTAWALLWWRRREHARIGED